MKKYRILLVDDDPFVLKTIRLMLSRDDYVICTADSGEEAIEKLSRKEFDLIATDLKMPEIDGEALLNYARTEDLKSRRIMISGTIDKIPEMVSKGLVHAYLAKPVAREHLHKVVDEQLELVANR